MKELLARVTLIKYVEKRIKEMPSGLDREILSYLRYHIGKDSAIPREGLLAMVRSSGFPITDRVLRDQINTLKKDEYPICSTGGVGGGYYFAKDWTELEEYIEHELISRIADLSEQRKALQLGAKKLWGVNSPQIGLL
jgi:hypothetical protein